MTKKVLVRFLNGRPWRRDAGPDELYTLRFGQFLCIQWPDEGSEYWHPDSSEIRAALDVRKGKVLRTGSVYCSNSGCYYQDEDEFRECIRLMRGTIIDVCSVEQDDSKS
jgi:hypothetical protein